MLENNFMLNEESLKEIRKINPIAIFFKDLKMVI